MLLYCVPKVIQVGAEFQVRQRIDLAGMKVKQLSRIVTAYIYTGSCFPRLPPEQH